MGTSAGDKPRPRGQESGRAGVAVLAADGCLRHLIAAPLPPPPAPVSPLVVLSVGGGGRPSLVPAALPMG